MPSTTTLGNLFTSTELNKAYRLYTECKGTGFNRRCAAEIVEPVLERINKTTGQQNDARYWAYAIEYAIMSSGDL
jgi:hypothetical protein